MAKGSSNPSKKPNASSRNIEFSAATSTAVRNTAIPRIATPAAKEITRDQIARRAYEISQSSLCGTCDENWFRAERELRGM